MKVKVKVIVLDGYSDWTHASEKEVEIDDFSLKGIQHLEYDEDDKEEFEKDNLFDENGVFKPLITKALTRVSKSVISVIWGEEGGTIYVKMD